MTFSTPKAPARAGLATVLGLGVSLAAFAGLDSRAAAQDEAGDSETITVTATKREATLQDIPVAVSVVGQEAIKRAEIIDLRDLQSIVPSLRVGQLQSPGATNFFIRGFGNGANNAGIEPSVGVFIDGVYRSRSAAQISDLPNLERVEVLKGPQSTLFGKNASAGVISVVTSEPEFEFGGNVDATFGNFGATRIGGYWTGPMSDKLAFSIGGNLNRRDGYIDDIGTGIETNERNRWAVRGQLLYQPTPDLEFRLIGDYDAIDEVCCAVVNVVNGPTGAAVRAVGGNIITGAPFSNRVVYNFPSTNKIDNGGVSLQADWDIGFATITSITAKRTTESDTNQDSDFTSADLIGNNEVDAKLDTFTQELRLTSNAGERFDFMIGGFYFDESVTNDIDFRYGRSFRPYVDALTGGALRAVENAIGGAAAVGRLFGQQGQGLVEDFGQENTSWSVFGTLDFHATEKLTATIGLNYTEDEKQAFARQVNTDAFSQLDLVALGVAAGVPRAVAANPAFNPFLGLRAVQFLPPLLNFPNAVETGESQDTNTSYTLRLAYEVNDSLNVYAAAATGFKATSWNLSRDSRPFAADFIPGSPAQLPAPAASRIRSAGLAVPNLTAGTRFAGPEESLVYEIGIKAAWPRLSANIAIFDQTIEGFQSNIFTGTGFALANAGEQSTQGAELDLTWTPVDPLRIGLSVIALDPIYDSFPNSASGNLSGQKPSGIPELAVSLSGSYDFRIGEMDAYIRGDWQYESESAYFDDPANQRLINDERTVNLVNGSVGVTTPRGLTVSLWGRNIFDHEYITTAFPSVAQAGSLSGYPNDPPSYGVTLRQNF
jgi:outer membrane receptor protein involved in Fe transport